MTSPNTSVSPAVPSGEHCEPAPRLALQFGELKDALGGRQGLTEGRRRPSQLLDWAEQQEDVHQDADQLRRRQLTGIHGDHPGDQHHQERGREARRANGETA